MKRNTLLLYLILFTTCVKAQNIIYIDTVLARELGNNGTTFLYFGVSYIPKFIILDTNNLSKSYDIQYHLLDKAHLGYDYDTNVVKPWIDSLYNYNELNNITNELDSGGFPVLKIKVTNKFYRRYKKIITRDKINTSFDKFFRYQLIPVKIGVVYLSKDVGFHIDYELKGKGLITQDKFDKYLIVSFEVKK